MPECSALTGTKPIAPDNESFSPSPLALSPLELQEKSKNRIPKRYIIRFIVGKIAANKYTTKDFDSTASSIHKIKANYPLK